MLKYVNVKMEVNMVHMDVIWWETNRSFKAVKVIRQVTTLQLVNVNVVSKHVTVH